LRTKTFEQGFAKGKGLDEVGMTPKVMTWLEQAIDAYWHERLYSTLAQADKISSADLLCLWNEVMDDMYGEEVERKEEIRVMALDDDKVSLEAKKWLKTVVYT
jgi:hypothetical protein